MPGFDRRALSEMAYSYGLVESIKAFDFYAFVNFVEEKDGVNFWQAGQTPTLVLNHGLSRLTGARTPPRRSHQLGGARTRATRHVDVGPVNHQTTEEQVAQLVKSYGEIERCARPRAASRR